MKNENFIRVYDDVFSSQECDELIDIYTRYTGSDSSHIFFENWNTRQDTSINLNIVMNNSEEVGKFNERLTQALFRYAEEFPVLKTLEFASYDVKLQKTKPSGGYHNWHCEQAEYSVSARNIVWTVYLNDIEEGGETEFLYLSERIKPKKGSLMFFPASFTHTHRGNPPLVEDKYIATGWYNLIPK